MPLAKRRGAVPPVSVVFPTLGRMIWVLRLVQALRGGTRGPDKLILVDQAPKIERSPIALRELERLSCQGKVKFLFSSWAGAVLTNNAGAQVSSSEVIVFLDDDVRCCRNSYCVASGSSQIRRMTPRQA